MEKAFLERRYGVRIRTVVGLEERALIMRKQGLVLVDEALSASEWDHVVRGLAARPPAAHLGAGQSPPARPRQ